MKNSNLIIKLADREISKQEKEALEKELYKNPKLMKEYLTYLEMNEFLEEKFSPKEIKEGGPLVSQKKETLEKKSLEAEQEALNNGIFKESLDLVKEVKEKNSKFGYSEDLKEFIAFGLKNDEYTGITKKVKKRTVLLNKWYFLAASIVLLITISVVLDKYVFSRVNYSKLFTTYYKPYYFVTDQTRSSDPILDSMVNEATELFKSGDYSRALKASADVLDMNSKHVKARFIHGLTLIEAGKFMDASKEFKYILANYDSYNIESKWYLALCYLKLDKPKEAGKLLQELSLSKNLYQKKALELMEEL